MLAQILIVFGVALMGLLGTLHIVYTFFTNKLEPRDAATAIAMKATSPVLTRRVNFVYCHSMLPGGRIRAFLLRSTPRRVTKSEEWLVAAGTNFDGYPVRTCARALRQRSLPARMRASPGLEGSGSDES